MLDVTLKSWLELLMVTLTAYKMARMVTMEDGPFDLFLRIRSLVFNYFSEEHWLTKGFSCPFCVSFWLVPIAYFLPLELALWLGLAGLTSLLFSWEFKQ